MNSEVDNSAHIESFSRRNFIGVSSAVLATAAFGTLTVHAQERDNTRKAEG
jgi:hypothetical protein